jgi:hypothetical protein
MSSSPGESLLARSKTDWLRQTSAYTPTWGRIDNVSDSGYLVTLLDAGEVIRCSLSASTTRLPTGICVTRNLIEYGALRGEVQMPTVQLSILAKLREKQAAVTEDERGWNEMFNKIDFQPVVVPHVRDSVGRH